MLRLLTVGFFSEDELSGVDSYFVACIDLFLDVKDDGDFGVRDFDFSFDTEDDDVFRFVDLDGNVVFLFDDDELCCFISFVSIASI